MDIVDAKLCSIAICTLIECLSNLNEKTKQSRDQEDVKSVQSEVKDKVSLLSSSLVDIFDLAGSIDPFQSKNEKDLNWMGQFKRIAVYATKCSDHDEYTAWDKVRRD